MEKFCKHIEHLLAQHDYAVVPGLGGFVIQTQTAKIQANCIIPPLATVAFNPLMHHADGMLAIEIARSEQISYRAAVEQIDKTTASIRQQLKSGTKVLLGNLGELEQSTDGTLVFNPKEAFEFLPHNFLLSTLHVSQRMHKDVAEKRSITFTLPSTRTFKYAAAAMLIFGLFVSTPKVNNNGTTTADFSSFSFKSPKKDTTTANSTPDSIPTSETRKDSTQQTATSKPGFHIIVASLPTSEAAERYCKELSGKESEDARVLASTKTYRIAIRSYHSKEEAIRHMEELRKSDSRFEGAWVLCDQ